MLDLLVTVSALVERTIMKGALDMRIKWFFFLVQTVGIGLLLLSMSASVSVKAESVSSLETNGTVGFYGTYESENNPQPEPPYGDSATPPNLDTGKPGGGKLPQLGHLLSRKWMWIGSLLVGLIFLKSRKTNWKVV